MSRTIADELWNERREDRLRALRTMITGSPTATVFTCAFCGTMTGGPTCPQSTEREIHDSLHVMSDVDLLDHDDLDLLRRSGVRVSLDNGQTYQSPTDLTEAQLARAWDALVNAMDDNIRERVHTEIVAREVCTMAVFLARYCELAQCDLVIG